MPVYEFNCVDHGNFESYQGINEEHTEVCPVCKKVSRRLYAVVNIAGDLPTINKAKSLESEKNMKATPL